MKMLLTLAICLSTVLTFCPGTFTAPFIACTFDYEYQDSNCTQFILDNCTWTQCVAYTTIDNYTQCTQYQDFSSTSWSQCTSKCCLSSNTYPQSYDSLLQCQADNKRIIILILTIIGSIIGGVVVLILLICLVRKCLSNPPSCRCKMQRLIYLLTCRCFINRNKQKRQEVEINTNVTQNQQPFEQTATPQPLCVMCIEKGLRPYQTPFLQPPEKQPYVCDSCKKAMNAGF